MPRHDYLCDRCGSVKEFSVSNWDEYTKTIHCPDCKDGLMHRQPAAPSFTVKGYSAKNGYSEKS